MTQTKKAAILGWPVDHSLSPALYAYWFKEYHINGSYDKLAVEPGSLKHTLHRMMEEGYAGCNLTLPHKEPALDLMDELSPMAARIGAVNTVVFEDGMIKGDNTDWYGFIQNLNHLAPEWRPKRPAIVIGAGGAARAVIVALIEAGIHTLHILNRDLERAQALALDLATDDCVLFAHPLDDVTVFEDAGILVNATSLGMTDMPPLPVKFEALPTDAIVTDVIYTPLQTDFLKTAAVRGHPTIDGLGMLLHQARPGFEAWFGLMPEVTDDLRRHMLDLL